MKFIFVLNSQNFLFVVLFHSEPLKISFGRNCNKSGFRFLETVKKPHMIPPFGNKNQIRTGFVAETICLFLLGVSQLDFRDKVRKNLKICAFDLF